MKRIIYCTFLKKKSEGQKIQIYPGSIGKKIYNEISQKAWSQWQLKQTILINEKQLNMSKKTDQKKLEKYMKLFLFKK